MVEKIKANQKNNILLEQATEADFDAIIELENKVKSRTYIPLGDANQLAEIMAKGPIYKVKKDGELAGIAAYYSKDDGMYIDALAIDPKYQGQGLGREALIQLLGKIEDTVKTVLNMTSFL